MKSLMWWAATANIIVDILIPSVPLPLPTPGTAVCYYILCSVDYYFALLNASQSRFYVRS